MSLLSTTNIQSGRTGKLTVNQQATEQGAAPDRLQLRSFLAPLPAAGELDRCGAARGLAAQY